MLDLWKQRCSSVSHQSRPIVDRANVCFATLLNIPYCRNFRCRIVMLAPTYILHMCERLSLSYDAPYRQSLASSQSAILPFPPDKVHRPGAGPSTAQLCYNPSRHVLYNVFPIVQRSSLDDAQLVVIQGKYYATKHDSSFNCQIFSL